MSEHRIDLSRLAKIRDGTGHTVFSPSSSHMWLACPGSLIPNLLAQDDAGEDAAYGTVAHGITEQWLRAGKPPLHRLGTNEFVESGDWGFLIDIDEQMFEYAEQCVDACEWEPGLHLVEQKVWFSQYMPIPNQGGTMDFSALMDGRMHTRDHKFGKADTIYAEENSQGMLYSLGIFLQYDEQFHFEDIIVGINQPRLNHFDEWHTTRKHLLDFAEYVRERAAIAWAHDAPRVPGPKQCRYCRVKATCAANAMMQVELVASAFEAVTDEYTPQKMQAFKDRLDDELDTYDLATIPVATLTTAQLARLKPFRKPAEAWWSAVDEELERRGIQGETIPGFKLVEGRSFRRVKNETKFIETLRAHHVPESEIWKRELISPAQAEDAVVKYGKIRRKHVPQVFAAVVEKPPGKPTLVPLHDKRDAIVESTADVFTDESL